MSVLNSWHKHCSIFTLFVAGILFVSCMDEGPAGPSSEGLKDIVITEINYNPEPADSTDTCKYEFIEIRNNGTSSCDMSDVEFTSGITYKFPKGSVINAGDFYVIAENAADFKKRYGVDPDDVYTGSLKNSGETIVITDVKTDKQVLSATYSDASPWPSKADGDGYTLVPNKPVVSNNPDEAAYWGLSTAKKGSPGADEPVVVYINEVLAHTDPPDYDWVELYNPENSPVSIGGWYLTDAQDDPQKYKIPDGTIVPAGGYLVISELQFNDSSKIASGVSPFRIDSHGEEIYLIPPSGVCTGGQCQKCKFGELENGVSIGRYITSTGSDHYPIMKEKTPGAANSAVAVGPVVISEIMYNPPAGLYEYVVVTNIASTDVPLYYKTDDSTHTWKVKGAGFKFPANITIKPSEKIYIVSDTITVDSFRTLMKLAATVQIFAASMDLDDGGEELALMKPEDPYYEAADTLRPHMTIDEIDYNNSSPWPKDADGRGYSLVRISNVAYGNDPINWKAEKRAP
ncbi:MAG TPA: lamin tail domain-containing protein [Chitinispirillaceae bacterium]|nr:lamin tail domain-containing protein [Chitinispirillaceae bacterium]